MVFQRKRTEFAELLAILLQNPSSNQKKTLRSAYFKLLFSAFIIRFSLVDRSLSRHQSKVKPPPLVIIMGGVFNTENVSLIKKTRRPSRVSGDRRRIYAFGSASGGINRRRRHRDRHRGHHRDYRRDRRRDQAGGCRLRGRARCAPRHIRGRFRWPRRSRIRTRCCP